MVVCDDLIRRQGAIDALGEEPEVWCEQDDYELGLNNQWHYDVYALKAVPSAQPEVSRIENALHGKSAEEQYDFIRWLMFDYGMCATDTRDAVIEWLKGREEREEDE